jgi:peptidoglycan/LPS O-acetylase OafA/YrhL
VIFFHAHIRGFRNGFLGVDLFFFITGFVLYPQIARIVYSDKRINQIAQFYKKRCYRLFPTYLFCTVFSLVAISFLASFADHQKIVRQLIYSQLLIGNIGASLQSGDYFHPAPNPYLHYWSLSSEWQIYLVIPLLIGIFRIKTISRFKLLLLIITIISLFLSATGESNHLEILNYYSPLTRLWEFSIGFLLGETWDRKSGLIENVTFSRLMTFIMFIAFLTVRTSFVIFGQSLAMLFFFFFLHSDFKLPKPFNDFLRWIGDRSYSIYLVHLPLLYLAQYSPTSPNQTKYREIAIFLSILITLSISAISYKCTESPVILSKRYEGSSDLPFGMPYLIQYLVSLIGLFSLFFATQNYGEYKGSRVGVAWQKIPTCKDSSDYCTIVDNNATSSILLIGDSHIVHYFLVFRDLGNEKNLNVYYLNRKSDYFADSSHMKNLFVHISRLKVKYVFLSQYDVNANSNSISLYKKGMAQLKKIEKVQDYTKIFYLGDNPVFSDFHVYTNFMNPSLSYLIFKPSKLADISEKSMDSQKYLLGLNYLSYAKSIGLKNINIYDYFCNRLVCKRSQDGKFLFFDDHHLSTYGAKQIETLLRRIII